MNKLPALVLSLFIVLPGLSIAGICGYYTLQDWSALEGAFSKYQTPAASGNASEQDLAIASHTEIRHRINCFADGVGVMFGAVVTAIGIHGICTLGNHNEF